MDLSDFFGNHDIQWMDDAVCANHTEPDIFFPPRDKELYKKIADEAKTFCNVCPVRADCLWYAVASDAVHGIWGGLSHRERNALVRKWARDYKKTMTLKEYIFQVNTKGKLNGGTSKV